MEEKSREIGEAAKRYVGHRWVNWLPLLIMPLGIGWMLLAAWLVKLGIRLAGGPPESPQGHSLFLKIFFPIAFAGILVLISLFAVWYDAWRKRKLAVQTKAEARPISVGRFLFTSFYFGLTAVIPRDICEHVPLRFAPLVLFLWFGLPIPLAIAMKWIPRPKGVRGIWRESPVNAVTIGLCGAYGLATAAGLPQPWTGDPSQGGYPLRVMAPFVAALLVAIVAGELYSRRQFRRLQRLVDEDPSRKGNSNA